MGAMSERDWSKADAASVTCRSCAEAHLRFRASGSNVRAAGQAVNWRSAKEQSLAAKAWSTWGELPR